MKYEESMPYYNYRPTELGKMEHKEPPLFSSSTFWTFILVTALLLFAIALLSRGF
jgi:hypothetical protein